MRGWKAGAGEAGALVLTWRIGEAVERVAAGGGQHGGAWVGGGWCGLSRRVE